jgi:hypothetical protein
MSIFIRTFLAGAIVFFFGQVASGQVKVRGGFFSDSTRIGERVGYYLSAKYPSKEVVLFPDSSFSFATFEYKDKKYFTTESNNGINTDSAIYYLNPYDIEQMQRLELPVFLISPQDCTSYTSNSDSIKIIRTTAHIGDTLTIAQLPLQIDTSYRELDRPLNLMMIFLITGAMLVIAGTVWMAFGEKMTAYFAVRKLQKKHADFLGRYNPKVEQLRSEFSPVITESAVYIWKRYMEELEARPYTKLTSTETMRLYGDEVLGRHLRLADRAIYANDRSALPALDELRHVADAHFKNKLKEVTHGIGK